MPLPIETGPDETHAHPRHTGRGRLDLVLALAAIFISMVSLFVAIEHGRTEGKLLAAGTWPFLQLTEDDKPDAVDLAVNNAGVGPAKLVTLRMLLDGRPVRDAAAFAEACCGRPLAAIRDHLLTSEIENSVMRPGQRDVILRFLPTPADPGLQASATRAIRRVHWDACYCSVFDECWISDLVSLKPRPVATCPPISDGFNQHFYS